MGTSAEQCPDDSTRLAGDTPQGAPQCASGDGSRLLARSQTIFPDTAKPESTGHAPQPWGDPHASSEVSNVRVAAAARLFSFQDFVPVENHNDVYRATQPFSSTCNNSAIGSTCNSSTSCGVAKSVAAAAAAHTLTQTRLSLQVPT